MIFEITWQGETVLHEAFIDDNDNRIICNDFTKLRINEAN